jgi:hypothetical protein
VSRPRHIPNRGDVAPAAIAQLLGLSITDFERLRPELDRRGFPSPDVTTGQYCVEAVDKWRLQRHAMFFPELTHTPTAIHAGAVFDVRLRQMGEGRG